MRRIFTALLVMSLCAPIALAQNPPPPATDGAASPPALKGEAAKEGKDKDNEEDADAPSSSSDGIVPLPGDTVYFKNGSKLEGVTVVRESPAGVEVKVTDADSLMIPRKQIDRIERQKVDEMASDADAAAAEPSILKGQKVSNELYAKLTSELPGDSLDFKEVDLVEALETLATKLDITIEISADVKKIAPRDRRWTLSLPAGSKLTNLLEDGLLSSFPNLQLDFPQDKIVVSVKADAAGSK